VAVVGEDPEGVHQVRVSAGRLAVWLEMGGRSVLRDDLRALRRCAAAVRDCDVLLGRGVPDGFASRLRERRDLARREMLAHLRGPHARALRQALALLPALPRADAERSLRSFRDRVIRRGDALTAAPVPHDEEFHALRRAIRKLRYALEWMGRDASAVKALQGTFGDLNDAAVELRLLEETGSASECPEHVSRLRSRIAEQRRQALAEWLVSREFVAALAREDAP
jgi:CHAD domain-containing protein